MSLFQHSVLNKYLKDANQDEMKSAYRRLVLFFHNTHIQQNIRESKEEQFQEGFLRELFVSVLGYTINPDPNFNLTTEFKNERGAKKADGAILKEGAAVGVIELKSTKTKDLESIRLQAFDYKANQQKCVYIITSNFEKVRFYINNAVDFEEFDLFKLKYERFQLLWLCLAKENVLNGVPLAIKEASILKEENVTKQIYVDYSLFKRELYSDLISNNLELEIFNGKEEKEIKLQLFKKSQKLLDRFLFIFFGEDRGLLPPNSISSILKQWEQLKELDEYKPLYDRYKKYFNYLNTGWKGKQYEIFAYNGGLFAPDEILDSIIISDEVLQKHTKVLTAYDFETDVDVNILGHIFENSLDEIENVQTEIMASTRGHVPLANVPLANTPLTKSERKKDGIFYTPKYITKYIVENTIGKLCDEKKTELGIEESKYLKNRKGRPVQKLKKLDEKLVTYRNWLLTLTICDPACGSGAFLNQALNFLIHEHHYIDELKAKLLDVPMIFTEVENSILENNIFGVDINEESVEIAKLSLWLRTAQKGRKLTTLSNNIKCGNSLIDDSEIAGEKAFNWHTEFPDIFRKKKKQVWHITTATHNSRYSQRMFDYRIKTEDAIWLSGKNEIIITETIAEIVKKDNLNIVEYNICGDHMHLLLICEKEELTKIVGKLKAVSARKYNIENGITVPVAREGSTDTDTGTATRGHVPLSEELSPSGDSSSPGYISLPEDPSVFENPSGKKKYNSLWTQKFGKSKIKDESYLNNAINYIRDNKIKHELPKSERIEKIKKEFLCTREHAFRTEYTGGFDVVIGNPPYVSKTFSSEMKLFLKNNYQTAQYQLDLYVSFMEKASMIANDKGKISYIVPNSWMKNLMFTQCRYYLATNLTFEIIIPNLNNVFNDASVDTLIFIAQNFKQTNNEIIIGEFINSYFSFKHKIIQDRFIKNDKYIFDVEINAKSENIFKKIDSTSLRLENICDVTRGINPYDKYRGQSEDVIKNKLYHANYKKDETFVPEIRGRHVNRYMYEWGSNSYVSYGDWLAAPREPKYFKGERIICRQVLSSHLNCCVISEDIIIDQSVFIGKIKEESKDLYFAKYILCLFASKLFSFYFRFKANEFDALFPKIKIGEYKNLPIKPIKIESQKTYVKKAEEFENFLKQKSTLQNKFLKYLQSKFQIEKPSKKLQNWHQLNFSEFIKELNKTIKTSNKQRLDNGVHPIAELRKTDEMEWMDLFETKKAEAQNLKSEIDKTDREIDLMVYQLYNLTYDEVKIVDPDFQLSKEQFESNLFANTNENN